VHPSEIPYTELQAACTGTISFWWALPFCVFFSALTGAMLGVPVLRLRGDYLAIVTLGFGEIMNRVVLSDTFKSYLGGPQGISPIPYPRIDLSGINSGWVANFSTSTNIYYLFLFAVAITAFVVYRLANSRVGRAWRAVKADEDVAQAMGIELVKTKLLAFGVSSAFAGLGGAIFGGMLQGIFPNSFTLLVSINVLSLIIIGGMGSISGVFVGAMLLVGLPELLRELESYRMLSFGALLVTVMLIKPEGLIPPKPPRLSEALSADDAENREQ
jgi:branched-chain amino acid transport system permease protein